MKILVFIFCFLPFLAQAETVGKVRLVRGKKVSFKITKKIVKRGDILQVEGTECNYRVIKIKKGTLGFAVKEDCPPKLKPENGAALILQGLEDAEELDEREKSFSAEDDKDGDKEIRKPRKKRRKKRRGGFFANLNYTVFGNYTLGSDVKTTGTISNRTPPEFSHNFSTPGGIEIGVDATYYFWNKLGVLGGFLYGLDKNLNAIDGSSNFGFSYVLPHVELRYDITPLIYASGGLNYSFTVFANASTSAGLGYQASGGYMVSDSFSMELQYRIITFTGKESNSGVDVIFDSAEYSTIVLRGKYHF